VRTDNTGSEVYKSGVENEIEQNFFFQAKGLRGKTDNFFRRKAVTPETPYKNDKKKKHKNIVL